MKKHAQKTLTTAALLMVFSAFVLGGTAENKTVPDISFDVEAIKARLDLSEEQEPGISEILEKHATQRTILLKKYELEPTPQGDRDFSIFTLRTFRGEIRKLGKQTRQKMATGLNKEQFSEWVLIQKENVALLREYLLAD